jgi:signal transduction histidine kinase
MNTSRLQLRAVLARRQRLTEEQHARLARRIHDDISQKLTLLALQLSLEASEAVPARLEANPNLAPGGKKWTPGVLYPSLPGGMGPTSPLAEKCKAWSALVMEIGQAVRDITDILQPKVVEEFGLVAGLQWYSMSLSKEIPCTFTPPERDILLPRGVGRELFGICWEVVTTIFRPETTSRIDLQVQQVDGVVTIHLHGNDKVEGGLNDPEQELDLMSITERLLRIGGTVEVSGRPGSGTTVTLCLPPRGRRRPEIPPVGPKIYAQSAVG